jgi:cytochrome c biogenesis protein CcmG/thiol:disulfide interchange protein DsbE
VTRAQWVGLVGVVLLLVTAFVVGQREPEPLGGDSGLDELRAAAALPACPPGLGLDVDLSLPCLDGGPDVAVGAPLAGPTVVNIWGTWCAPCVEEVPELVAFAERAAGRVAVVGVLTSDTARNGLAFADDFDMNYPQVLDDQGEVRARYGAGAPLTLFLQGDGTLVHVESGAMDSLEEIERLAATHLGVQL